MKLLFIIPSYRGGGAELVFIKLANYLSKHHAVSLFVISPNGHHKGRVDDTVNLVESQTERTRSAWIEILRLHHKEKFEKIYATLVYPIVLLGLIKFLFPITAKTVARPANIIQREQKSRSIISWLYLFFLKRFDVVIAQNALIADYIRSCSDVDVKIIPNPITICDQLDHPRTAEQFIWVGRLAHQKNFELLIAAATRCNAVIHVYLKPEDIEEATKMTQEGGLTNITIMPFTKDILTKMAAAKALILTSRFEGLSNVMLESLSVGTPVITTKFDGGGHEFLNSKNSKYYSTADQLADILDQDLGLGSRREIASSVQERCSYEVVGCQYLSI